MTARKKIKERKIQKGSLMHNKTLYLYRPMMRNFIKEPIQYGWKMLWHF